MNLESAGRALIVLGLVLLVVGGLLALLGRLGLMRLPGDILIRRGNSTIFFPIVSAIVISIILTVLLNFIAWLGRR